MVKICCYLLHVIAGPTGSGKSVVCKKLLENATAFINPTPVECIFNYSIWQNLYDDIHCPFPIRFIEGITRIEDLPQDGKHRIWIIDDAMQDVSQSAAISDLYTKYSHHLNYSVIILCQNLFEKGRHFRTISLNTQYLFILKSIRDASIISTLGRQMGNTQFLNECYKDAVSTPFGYLFIDMKPGSEDKYRVRAQIFEHPMIVYVKK